MFLAAVAGLCDAAALSASQLQTENVSGRRGRSILRHLYVQVLLAVVLGAVLGHVAPSLGKSLQPLGEGFIKLIKMLIAPVIFCTVVHGIASLEDMKKLGRVGLKAVVYFEVVSTLALIIGLIVVNLLKPG